MKDPSKIIGPLGDIIQAMTESHGLDVSRYDEAFLGQAISKRLAASGIATLAAYGEHLAKSASEAEAFFGSLHVNHSEFFRNPLSFAVLEQLIFPGLVEAKKKSGDIRIWSAGCAGGQEAWSIAMLLDEISQAQTQPLSYRIFATDLDETNLSLARAGIYSEEALGKVRLQHMSKYLFRQGDSFAIAPRLRAHVDFSPYDLLDGSSSSPSASIYGGFDLILCCNLLFYYRPEGRRRILDKFSRALAPGGYFVTGEVERTTVSGHKGFRALLPPAAVFRKTNVSP